MKLLPLVGALILSVAPVQASKTPGGLMKPCETSDAAMEACLAAGLYMTSAAINTLLCDLRKNGEITPEVFAKREKQSNTKITKEIQKAAWNEGLKMVQKSHPFCPIKPIP